MIRDEFLKDKYKKLSPKNVKKMREVGERAFYSSEVSLLKSTLKTFDVTSVIIGALVAVFTVLLIDIIIQQKGFGEGPKLIIGTVIDLLLLFSIAAWFLCIRFSVKKKIAKYMQELKKLNEKEMDKQKAIYNKIYKK